MEKQQVASRGFVTPAKAGAQVVSSYTSDSRQPIRTFGRVRGKKLSARQEWLVENLLPCVIPGRDALFRGREPGISSTHGKYNNTPLFDTISRVRPSHDGARTTRDDTYILEIGFGAGEHLLELAEQNPDSIIIGAEPFINGVASILSRMTRQEINNEQFYSDLIKPEYRNIRIFPDDVRKLLSPCASRVTHHASRQDINLRFAKIYILHPDPWPKARHEKRRLLSVDFLAALGDLLTPSGQIIIGTDHHEYFDWILANANRSQLKINNEQLTIIETRYQKKNMAGTDRTKYLVLCRGE